MTDVATAEEATSIIEKLCWALRKIEH